MNVDGRYCTAIHEAGHAVVALCIDFKVSCCHVFREGHGYTSVGTPEPPTARLMEQMYRSYGAIAIAGNRAVRRILGDAVADKELADADLSVAHDGVQAGERADEVVNLAGGDREVVLLSFEAEVDKLLEHDVVRKAIKLVAEQLMTGNGDLDAEELRNAFDAAGEA